MNKNSVVKFETLTVLLLVAIFSLGCNPVETDILSEKDCIPPLFDLAYPVQQPRSYEPEIKPLPDAWKYQFGEADSDMIHDIILRDEDEIWVTEPLMKYTPSTGYLKKYFIENEDGNKFSPRRLFLSTDKTLWAIGSIPVEKSGERSGFTLSRFDDGKDRFEIITDKDGIFSSLGIESQLVEDQEGNLWMVSNDSLIKYDPVSNMALSVLGRDHGYLISSSSILASGDGTIWVSAILTKEIDVSYQVDHAHVIQYDPLTGAVYDYGTPPDAQTHFFMFFDHLGRLWVWDYAWLEISETGSGNWFRVIRSPIFISDKPVDYAQYGWFRPIPRLETMDQYIWFTFYGGLVRLDLNTHHWCLLTNSQVTAIMADNENNIWIAANGQVYIFRQQP